MRIGVPKEIKDHEYRVALTPEGVQELVRDGHEVRVQSGAGEGIRISDADYRRAGAIVVSEAAEAWDAELVVKVKEPLPQEYRYLRAGQWLFTYLHLAGMPETAQALLDAKVRAIGYETVQLHDGRLPLLAPMSRIAGKMGVQIAAMLLHRNQGGKGCLLGGTVGTSAGRVLVIGAGNTGTQAARAAHALGAEVIVLDCAMEQLARIDEVFAGRVHTRLATEHALAELVPQADCVIGAALVPGARAPRLLSRAMLASMQDGSVLIDIAIDQGGISETSRPTSHSEPTYCEEGVLHYCVPNMPGAVPITSTQALAGAVFGYLRKLARDPIAAIRTDAALRRGVNTWDGQLVCEAVARSLGLPFVLLDALLEAMPPSQ